MQNAMKAESQTAYKGTSCRFTFTQNLDNGTAPSLENAYNILQQCRGRPSEDIQLIDLIRWQFLWCEQAQHSTMFPQPNSEILWQMQLFFNKVNAYFKENGQGLWLYGLDI